MSRKWLGRHLMHLLPSWAIGALATVGLVWALPSLQNDVAIGRLASLYMVYLGVSFLFEGVDKTEE